MRLTLDIYLAVGGGISHPLCSSRLSVAPCPMSMRCATVSEKSELSTQQNLPSKSGVLDVPKTLQFSVSWSWNDYMVKNLRQNFRDLHQWIRAGCHYLRFVVTCRGKLIIRITVTGFDERNIDIEMCC